MLILSRVCAEFHDKSGEPIFTVTPRMRLSFQEAPEAIREDPLFQLLLNDHSIEVTEDRARRRQLENNPAAPAADEKAEPVKTDEKTEKTEKPAAKKPAEKKE